MDLQNPDLSLEQRQNFLRAWNNLYPCASGQGFCGMIVFRLGAVYLERYGEEALRVSGLERAIVLGTGMGHQNPKFIFQSGDWVECQGSRLESKLAVKSIQLLSPNLWVEGRQLEVNSIVQKWEEFIRKVRAFFDNSGFLHVNTPTLVACPGTEPFLEPFTTELRVGSRVETFYLPTSPELHLKKCLAKGWDRIYEIRPCFRNGEITPLHQPEFFMLEWYRAFSKMDIVQEDVRRLVETIAPGFRELNWVNKSVADLFKEFLQFDLRPDSSMDDLVILAKAHDIDVSRALDFDEVFFFLFLEKIEPHLHKYDCLYLHSYPPSQAALARLTPEGWGDRFEFYIRGLEIANAFNELNDPLVQRLRSTEDLNKKKQHGKSPVGLDEEFFEHLERGMPPSCGIALGLDRLFMGLNKIEEISSFRLFPK